MSNIILLSFASIILFGCFDYTPTSEENIKIWKAHISHLTPQERERDKQRCIQYQKTGSCLEYVESAKWTGKIVGWCDLEQQCAYIDKEVDTRRCWSLRRLLSVYKNACDLYDEPTTK